MDDGRFLSTMANCKPTAQGFDITSNGLCSQEDDTNSRTRVNAVTVGPKIRFLPLHSLSSSLSWAGTISSAVHAHFP